MWNTCLARSIPTTETDSIKPSLHVGDTRRNRHCRIAGYCSRGGWVHSIFIILNVAGTGNESRLLPAGISIGGNLISKRPPTRPAKKILLSRSYLPHDCVKLMIYMGWDR